MQLSVTKDMRGFRPLNIGIKLETEEELKSLYETLSFALDDLRAHYHHFNLSSLQKRVIKSRLAHLCALCWDSRSSRSW
jgi:hypothetical protein